MVLIRTKKLLVVFTLGVSLLQWEEQGIMGREIEIYNHYKEAGWDVTFLTYGDRREKEILKKHYGKKFKVIHLRNSYTSKKLLDNQFLNFFYSIKAIFLLQKINNQIDLIKSSQLYGSWICSIFSLLNKKPWLSRTGYNFFKFLDIDISRNQGLFFRSLKILILKKLHMYFAKYADKMIVTSQRDLNDTSLWFKGDIILNKNWVYTANFNSKDINAKAKNIIKTKILKILMVGRLEYQKRIDIAVKAVSNSASNLNLDIFGIGKQESYIRDLIEKYDDNRIRLLGSIDNKSLIKEMENYNIFISTSEIEGSPKALLEAMGSGLLIIARRCSGNSELIKNGVNGFLFDNINQLKDIIENIKSLDQNQIKNMIFLNYKKVKSEHDLEKFAKKEINLANSLLSK